MPENAEVEHETPEDYGEEETEMEFYLWLMTRGIHNTYSGCRAAFEMLDQETRLALWTEYAEEWGD